MGSVVSLRGEFFLGSTTPLAGLSLRGEFFLASVPLAALSLRGGRGILPLLSLRGEIRGIDCELLSGCSNSSFFGCAALLLPILVNPFRGAGSLLTATGTGTGGGGGLCFLGLVFTSSTSLSISESSDSESKCSTARKLKSTHAYCYFTRKTYFSHHAWASKAD